MRAHCRPPEGRQRSRNAFARAAPSRCAGSGSAANSARRVWTESPKIGTSAGNSRTSCSGSRSIRISLPSKRSGSGRGYISVSPNSVPTASTTSACRSASRTGGQAMFSPARRGCAAGRMPLALTVLITGRSSRSASSLASRAAATAPPPRTISGRAASRKSLAARASRSGAGAGREGRGRGASGARRRKR